MQHLKLGGAAEGQQFAVSGVAAVAEPRTPTGAQLLWHKEALRTLRWFSVGQQVGQRYVRAS